MLDILQVKICRIRKPGWLVFGLVLAALHQGCGSFRTMDPGITIALEAGPTSLDPRIGLSAESERIQQLIFSSLVRRGKRFEILPDLATHWEIIDPLTYCFHLRTGVRFHDGNPLTSRDVKYTFESLLNGSLVSPKSSTFQLIQSMATPDEHTIFFRLKEPFAGFLWNLTNGGIGIVPHGAGKDFQHKPIGSGPYRFLSYSHEEELLLEANSDYFGGAPTSGRIRFMVIPDSTTRALELRKGSIDIAQNVLTPDFVMALAHVPHLRVAAVPGTNYQYIGLNLRDTVLQDKRVRKAIAYAIPREDIIRYYWRGLVTPASSLLPPNHWAYEPNVERYPYDPEKARNLLDTAGWKDPDGRGPLPRFKLTFRTSTEESSRQVAAIIQQALKEVGIAVDLRSYEFGTFYADIVRGNFQIYSLRWIGGNNDPDLFERAFHSRGVSPKGYNRGRYVNPEVDQLLDYARQEPNQEKRCTAYSRIQKILAEDLPYISLWYMDTVCVYSRRLSEIELSPAGNFDFLQTLKIKNESKTQDISENGKDIWSLCCAM
jgi:peptide/nickel transport system substrate-binding protein